MTNRQFLFCAKNFIDFFGFYVEKLTWIDCSQQVQFFEIDILKIMYFYRYLKKLYSQNSKIQCNFKSKHQYSFISLSKNLIAKFRAFYNFSSIQHSLTSYQKIKDDLSIQAYSSPKNLTKKF
jgi:hypothetical protein